MSVLKAHPEDNVFRIYSLRVAFALIVDPHTIHGPPRDSRSSSSGTDAHTRARLSLLHILARLPRHTRANLQMNAL
ncbi:hypothetical protein CC2G_008324 [Coprinopsis cinerea AmutBmut pab1-1]|nr:hypothetical protein CC2G_008324 [Coprinopsis cinerea AmutBmut pab1-1]